MVLSSDAFARLCRARSLLREGALPIRDVAREAGMSQFHFIRRFEAVFGVTPHQYRIGLRLDHAKQLLAHGRHSVTEVCMEIGMSSLGSFSDLFTRRFGEPPSAYQRRAAEVGLDKMFPGCMNLMAFRNFQEAEPPPDTVES